MTDQDEMNVAVVKKAYATAEEGLGWEAFFADFTDESELYEAPSLPYGGIYRGKNSIVRGAHTVFSTFDDFHFEVLGYMAGGENVIAHVLLTGRGKKTGKTFSMPLMEQWRIRNGKVIELRPFYFDSARVSECFGS
jgi:uncharacterized protein